MANEKLQEYYCSRKWGLRKEAVHERSGGICERCQVNKGQAVHHKTYARLYNEDLEDLMHLCDGCHQFIHGKNDFDPAASVIYETNKITIDDESSNKSELCCPHCGDVYLHHSNIIIYERGEDQDAIITTVIDHKDNRVPSSSFTTENNPSRRRHGLTIQFWCECCDAISNLNIAQHKGNTFLSWKVTTNAKLQGDDDV
jgi:hypothetical protein